MNPLTVRIGWNFIKTSNKQGILAMAAVATSVGAGTTIPWQRLPVPASRITALSGVGRKLSSRRSAAAINAVVRHVLVEARSSSHGDVGQVVESAKEKLKAVLENRRIRNAAFAVLNVVTLSMPALALAAEEREKGKIFDFNLTLPIIVLEFLSLMVALDTIWFKPVGKFMDERDEMIRNMLGGVRDNSDEIKKLQDEAEAIIQAARAETTAELNKMKRKTAAELDAKLQKSRERIEQELAQALANLEQQKQDTLRSLEKQVQELSDRIVAKVLEGVS